MNGSVEQSATKEVFDPVVEGLKKIYRDKIRPIEESFKFESFHSSLLNDSDIEAKPMVLLLGQYSTGKTSFCRYLLRRDFPGAHIGPEPTTDRFTAIMYGKEERRIPGNALSVQTDKPFRGLSRFGTSFLQRMECSECPAPLLEHISLIDTPGVLSGEKQRLARGYDFTSVVEFFAQKADLILLLFDAHKLDISDEFRRVIECLHGNEDKIRCVLNKADQINMQQLMRVYGALMWALGKVVRNPEVMRVYLGSFWDEPYRNNEMAKLFRSEQQDLLKDLQSLPRQAAVRKCNEMVKRAKMCRVHALIITHLKKQMPSMFGRKKAQAELVKQLEQEFGKIHLITQIPEGDFPDVGRFREKLAMIELKKFVKLDKKTLQVLDEQVLSVDIPLLLKRYAQLADETPFNLNSLPPVPSVDDSFFVDSPAADHRSAAVPSYSSHQQSPSSQQQFPSFQQQFSSFQPQFPSSQQQQSPSSQPQFSSSQPQFPSSHSFSQSVPNPYTSAPRSNNDYGQQEYPPQPPPLPPAYHSNKLF
mmetsp:Transcript_2401/g.3645  ORF Transcript_2401/g.3645 Transcript_2401/m.3645 type:complete len:531 (-) Transcript_2401:775-2367(-)|eukprot:CAMPEP_0184647730 /NCGR_PEP_ID=MMETSP0308-20130426/4720_1 /TAXON_ID=38269 /ORGANISM="Gloeochaete witrockiana, Strain SAG 46.84" /LENGTH=530 /DNA_ID=CAMNT_0027078955 /DNA_START=52 /DNA_END=1644 /DNA_ORIENTATION=+